MNIDEKIRAARNRALAHYEEGLDEILREWPESPIERLFLAELLADDHRGGSLAPNTAMPSFYGYAEKHRESGIVMPRWNEPPPKCLSRESGMMWAMQVAVALPDLRCRLDFVVLPELYAQENGVRYRVAVELDGHDFHEKTKEQAKRDKRRDRILQTAGWIVLRFTGAEVYADVAECTLAATRAAASAIRSNR